MAAPSIGEKRQWRKYGGMQAQRSAGVAPGWRSDVAWRNQR
jgi:hypothetical protein